MRHALVVDDARAVRRIISGILQKLDYEVLEAENGRAALDLLTGLDFVPELALLDWNMPEMDGLEALRHIRAEPRWASMVILMVTTETEVERICLALEAGANEYIMKPFTPEILVERIAMAGAVV
ncbi:MAG TPA: response regulator [Bryobacteraceae bacterium]|nr:response regulator [Bryobacteraceae bacterium]